MAGETRPAHRQRAGRLHRPAHTRAGSPLGCAMASMTRLLLRSPADPWVSSALNRPWGEPRPMDERMRLAAPGRGGALAEGLLWNLGAYYLWAAVSAARPNRPGPGRAPAARPVAAKSFRQELAHEPTQHWLWASRPFRRLPCAALPMFAVLAQCSILAGVKAQTQPLGTP